MVTATSEWPEMGTHIKCYVSEGVEIHGMDLADCREKANAVGHRYIQYFASEQICATAATCDDAIRFSTGWKVFWRPQGPQGAVQLPLPKPAPATPSPTAPPAPPAPATSELCTARTANVVWNHVRCQASCGNADSCSSQSQCIKFCSSECLCTGTSAPMESCIASTSNPVWNDARCQDRCGDADDCGSPQSQCATFCAGCPCA